jgi:ubiquinone biosynthesis protein UbiJ
MVGHRNSEGARAENAGSDNDEHENLSSVVRSLIAGSVCLYCPLTKSAQKQFEEIKLEVNGDSRFVTKLNELLRHARRQWIQ